MCFHNCTCSGLEVQETGFAEYLSGRVTERYYDVEGTDRLVEEFPGMAATGFESNVLRDASSSIPAPKPWQVGESLSECFLEDHKDARFPHHSRRDLKNPNASPTGADLVGYSHLGDTTLFLFGEVKTSSEDHCPPPVVARLRKQLQDLGSCKIRHSIIMWLCFKVADLEDDNLDKQDFRKALDSYCQEKFKIVGVLIRDITPQKKDLEGLFIQVKTDLYPQRHIELLALYLPVAISELPEKISGHKHGQD